MLIRAPVPAWEITSGTPMNTDEAGVTPDRVSSSTPITRMLRFRGAGIFTASASVRGSRRVLAAAPHHDER